MKDTHCACRLFYPLSKIATRHHNSLNRLYFLIWCNIAFEFPTTRWQTCGTSILDQNYDMLLFKVFEEIAEQVSYCIIDAEAVQFIACE